MQGQVRIENLGKTYHTKQRKGLFKSEAKRVEALIGVSFEIRPGEIFGLLGPNGAGKTTLIKCLTTLLLPTSGAAWINGYQLTKDDNRIRGVVSEVAYRGDQSVYLVRLAGGRQVRFEDVVASEQPAQQAAAVVAGPLALLAGNDFEKVAVENLTLTVDAVESREAATLVRAWVDAPLPLRPGSVVPVRVQLRTRRGESVTETLSIEVPASATGGSYTLLVADARTMDQVEQREMRQAFAPRDLDQLVRALNRLRAGNRIYARLTRAAGGAVVGGEYLPALPGSVLSVLSSSDQGTQVVPLPAAAVWQGEIRAPRAVTGWRQLSLPVER